MNWPCWPRSTHKIVFSDMTNAGEQVIPHTFAWPIGCDAFFCPRCHLRQTQKIQFAGSYKHSGQNIAIYGRVIGYSETKATIERIFKLWFNEYKLADMSYIDRFHPSKWAIYSVCIYHCMLCQFPSELYTYRAPNIPEKINSFTIFSAEIKLAISHKSSTRTTSKSDAVQRNSWKTTITFGTLRATIRRQMFCAIPFTKVESHVRDVYAAVTKNIRHCADPMSQSIQIIWRHKCSPSPRCHANWINNKVTAQKRAPPNGWE